MISFNVLGHPEAQGSMNAFCPVSPNADIESAIHALRADRCPQSGELADRLAAIGKWPAYQKHGPEAKTPGHFVATMHASNATKLNRWRKAIAKAAREAYPPSRYVHAVRVETQFWFRRPKIHYRQGKFSHLLRDNAPIRHAQYPDADKLLRAVLDSITGPVIHDDSQVYYAAAQKLWRPNREDPEGADVVVLFPEEGDDE